MDRKEQDRVKGSRDFTHLQQLFACICLTVRMLASKALQGSRWVEGVLNEERERKRRERNRLGWEAKNFRF